MLNLHFSLLPRWRGAAPLERAILAGDERTGVCVMALEEGLDTGPVYAAQEVPIGPREHLSELRRRLVGTGTGLLLELLDGGVAHLPEPRPQVGEATYADKITPADLELCWDRPANVLTRVVRLDRAWTTFRGQRLSVLDADVSPAPPPGPPPSPGTLVGETVVTGDGRLRLRVVRPAGRQPMDAPSWLRGVRPLPGERLGGPGGDPAGAGAAKPPEQ